MDVRLRGVGMASRFGSERAALLFGSGGVAIRRSLFGAASGLVGQSMARTTGSPRRRSAALLPVRLFPFG